MRNLSIRGREKRRVSEGARRANVSVAGRERESKRK